MACSSVMQSNINSLIQRPTKDPKSEILKFLYLYFLISDF